MRISWSCPCECERMCAGPSPGPAGPAPQAETGRHSDSDMWARIAFVEGFSSRSRRPGPLVCLLGWLEADTGRADRYWAAKGRYSDDLTVKLL